MLSQKEQELNRVAIKREHKKETQDHVKVQHMMNPIYVTKVNCICTTCSYN